MKGACVSLLLLSLDNGRPHDPGRNGLRGYRDWFRDPEHHARVCAETVGNRRLQHPYQLCEQQPNMGVDDNIREHGNESAVVPVSRRKRPPADSHLDPVDEQIKVRINDRIM